MRLLKFVSKHLALCCAAALIAAGLGLCFTRAGDAPRPIAPSRNGDVNCDGGIDVSDAVSILDWLFRGGESPCALAEAPPADLEALRDEVRGLKEAVDFCCRNPGPPSDQVVNSNVSSGPLAPGETFELLRVPADKWFVMTDSFLGASFMVLVEITEAGPRPVADVFRFSSTLGLRFAPGSTIAVQNMDPTANRAVGGLFIGYFADR